MVDTKWSKESVPITEKRAIKLAEQMLEEVGDYPPGFQYRIFRLAANPVEVSEKLSQMRDEHFKRLGKKPPKQEVFE